MARREVNFDIQFSSEINEEFFTNLFVAWMSGLAKKFNGQEFMFNGLCDYSFTTEFPNSSPSHIIIRRYYKNTRQRHIETEHIDYRLVLLTEWYATGEFNQKVNFQDGLKDGWHTFNKGMRRRKYIGGRWTNYEEKFVDCKWEYKLR